MLEVFFLHYKAIGKIFLFLFIYVVIASKLFMDNFKEHLLQNWNEYRSHPLIIPISGFIKRDPDKSIMKTIVSNFLSVIGALVSALFKILMVPIYAIMGIFSKIFKSVGSITARIRRQMAIIRGFLMKLVEKIYLRLQNGTAAITYFFIKMRESMKRTFGLFNLVINTIEHSFIFFETMVRGPIGTMGELTSNLGWYSAIFGLGPVLGQSTWNSAVCFGPRTILTLDNGLLRSITDVKVGDVLKDSNIVQAVLDVEYLYDRIFVIDSIEVTGSHLILYNNMWVRAEKHPDAILKEYEHGRVYSLITSRGIIEIGGQIFKDYLDTHNTKINIDIDNQVQMSLNRNVNYKYTNKISTDLVSGFPKSNIIRNGDIIGTIDISPTMLDMYYIDGILLSANTLVLESGIWVRAHSHSRAEHKGIINTPCVHYVSLSDKILFDNGLVIRDFMENKSPKFNKALDDYVDSNIHI